MVWEHEVISCNDGRVSYITRVSWFKKQAMDSGLWRRGEASDDKRGRHHTKQLVDWSRTSTLSSSQTDLAKPARCNEPNDRTFLEMEQMNNVCWHACFSLTPRGTEVDYIGSLQSAKWFDSPSQDLVVDILPAAPYGSTNTFKFIQ